jgi:hypothetical protein
VTVKDGKLAFTFADRPTQEPPENPDMDGSDLEPVLVE